MTDDPRRAAIAGLRRELAARPEGLVVTCAGVSMEPALRKGEQVTVRAADARRLAPGDAFLFGTVGGELELHRLVVALPGGWLVHRGDNQVAPGFGVTRVERVLGRAELARRPPARREVARALVETARRVPAAAARRARRVVARVRRRSR